MSRRMYDSIVMSITRYETRQGHYSYEQSKLVLQYKGLNGFLSALEKVRKYSVLLNESFFKHNKDNIKLHNTYNIEFHNTDNIEPNNTDNIKSHNAENTKENLEHLASQISKLVLRDGSKNVLQELCKKEQLNESCINKLEEDQASEQKNIISEAKGVYLSIEPKSDKRKQELLSSWTGKSKKCAQNSTRSIVVKANEKSIKKGEILNQDQKANRVLIEREEPRNLANNCYRKRKQNNKWVLRKSEDKSRRVLYNNITSDIRESSTKQENWKTELMEKKKQIKEKMNEEDNLET
ncbi:1629_t:CDS:2 [Gigaspora margarita]|uniref:1629_t:CDS:1 n=1 Tax=Gigaspora margarita TaxID=4874 RepID=A0ABN7ULM0_GIGMA|nr:1629_t:CDS:2 [Gigaspora margarita]